MGGPALDVTTAGAVSGLATSQWGAQLPLCSFLEFGGKTAQPGLITSGFSERGA